MLDRVVLAPANEPPLRDAIGAMLELGDVGLRPVFDRLGGRYPYEDLRLARLFHRLGFEPRPRVGGG